MQIYIYTYESSRYQIRRAGLLEFLYMRPEQLLVGSWLYENTWRHITRVSSHVTRVNTGDTQGISWKFLSGFTAHCGRRLEEAKASGGSVVNENAIESKCMGYETMEAVTVSKGKTSPVMRTTCSVQHACATGYCVAHQHARSIHDWIPFTTDWVALLDRIYIYIYTNEFPSPRMR